jgi:hypothetical protein
MAVLWFDAVKVQRYVNATQEDKPLGEPPLGGIDDTPSTSCLQTTKGLRELALGACLLKVAGGG